MLNEKSKTEILNAFVLSNLNYCPLVWHECGVLSTNAFEKNQERALCFTINDPVSDYDDLLRNVLKELN